MTVTVRLLPDANLLVATLGGSVTIADIVARIRANAADPQFRPDMDRLIFMQGDLNLSEAELSGVVAMKDEIISKYYAGKAPASGGGPMFRAALLARPSPNDSILRLFQVVMEMNGMAVDCRTFQDVAEALQWLGLTRLSADMFEDEMRGI